VFFDDWSAVLRVAVAGVASYVALLAMLRASGKRTLAKLNAFDLIVTVALGSSLAAILLTADVALAEGLLALGLLIGAQYLVAWTAVRVRGVRRLVKSTPTLLVRDGRLLEDRLRRQRVSPEEVRQAVRASGKGGLERVAALVLETDGTLSVIGCDEVGSGDALIDVEDPP
jgi:uncharacterized membrane protein YcaP (DUF421 family)